MEKSIYNFDPFIWARNVYGQVLEILHYATSIEIDPRLFQGIISSPKFWRNGLLWSHFGKLASVLKKNSNMDVLLESFQKIAGHLLFRNADGRVLLEIQTTQYLGHQWTPLNGWIGNWREMSNCSKVILMLSNCIMFCPFKKIKK